MLLHESATRALEDPASFSPLFYGIRDVTPAPISGLVRKATFSPLFYGIRDVTMKAANEAAERTAAFSPLFYGIRDVT